MADGKQDFLSRLRATFQGEAEEHLQDVAAGLVLLEQAQPGERKDHVARILRRLHTLKGAARAVDLSDLEAFSHALEGVFSALLDAGTSLSPAQFDTLHQACAMARSLSGPATGRMRNQAAALAARLDALAAELREAAPAVPATASDETGAVGAPEAAYPDMIRVDGKKLDAIRHQAEALLPIELGLLHQISDLLQLADEMAELREQERLAETGRRRLAQKRRTHVTGRTDPEAATAGETGNTAGEHGVRADRMELRCRRLASALGRTRDEFAAVRASLTAATLETALVPFASALRQLPGLVRNLARSRGKEVVLQLQGEQVQVDRRVLDVVREALIHLVTNAVDHGIEAADRRLAAGKPQAGTILIKAAPCGGNRVSVSVADDGSGIDLPGVIDAALKHGSLKPEQLAGLDEQRKLRVALHAGVSTSREVTPVSGRGVGLAVVAEKVAAAAGELLMTNSPGAGCSFELLLPVRLATLNGLVLRAGASRFVCPLSSVETVRRLGGDDVRTVEGRETLQAGGRVLPVIRLRHLLELSAQGDAEERTALIMRAGGNAFALLVDEIVSQQEVLPKSLGKQLRRVRYITGVTRLGDGSLAPILGLEDVGRHGVATGGAAAASRRAGAAGARRILVVEDSITSRLLLKHILEGAGYQVDTAVDGLDALSKLRQDEFDAVVSDIEMPRLDGLALTEHIRGNPRSADLPVILVTSLQSAEQRERGLHAGADAYVVKGAFDQDNLLTTLRRLI